jgi:DNA primase
MLDELLVIKARSVPLQAILGLLRGSRRTILCPFHGENTPSFVIYPKGDYFCFGCGKHGQGALDFLLDDGQISFQDAVNYLTNNF